MQFTRVVYFFVFLFWFFLQISCSGRGDSNRTAATQPDQTANNTASTNDNSEELGLLIKLPFQPEEAVWKEEPMSAQNAGDRLNEHKLTAVLLFSNENSANLVAQAEKIRSPESVLLTAEAWYPSELISQSEIGGESNLKASSYAANDFFQSPYLDGRISRVENSDYFILELFSK